MLDPVHFAEIIANYEQTRFGPELHDSGAGQAGLNLLARFQPDIIKLDMELIRGLDTSMPRRMIVNAVVKMCDSLGVTVIAEGIETAGELDALRTMGVRYVQGFYFAKPEFEALPPVALHLSEERRFA